MNDKDRRLLLEEIPRYMGENFDENMEVKTDMLKLAHHIMYDIKWASRETVLQMLINNEYGLR